MKQLRWLLLPLLCLLLGGCRAADRAVPSPLPPAAQFRAQAEILCGNASMQAEAERASDGALTLRLTEPAALQGLTVRYAGGKCVIRFQGLTLPLAAERLPQTLAAALLADAWEVIARRAEITRTLADGVWTLRGSGAHGAFDFTCSAADGTPLTLTIENAGLHIVFRDYQPLISS